MGRAPLLLSVNVLVGCVFSLYVYVYVCVHVCVYVRMYVCMYVCIYVGR